MLTPEQQNQIRKQIEAYENQTETKTVNISYGELSFALEVDPLVANPEIMNSGLEVVKYLVDNPDLIKNKIVIDMGTGSGIIGLCSGLLGAKKVLMADIDDRAVANAQRNILKQNLATNCESFQSDLFENFSERQLADVQIFNHPFFAGQPVEGKEWTRMMLAQTDLFKKYLLEAPKYSQPETVYIFPWLTLANNDVEEDNDPGKLAFKLGYEIVEVKEQIPDNYGLQKALFKIYKLKKSGS